MCTSAIPKNIGENNCIKADTKTKRQRYNGNVLPPLHTTAFENRRKKCSVCGKEFYDMAGTWAYKYTAINNTLKYQCTYKCYMIAFRLRNGNKRG